MYHKRVLNLFSKDTISTDKKDNKVDGHQDSRKVWPSIGHDAVIHDGGPVLPC